MVLKDLTNHTKLGSTQCQRILAVSLLREFLKWDKSDETQYQRILALGENTKSFKSLKASILKKYYILWCVSLKEIPRN